MVIQNIVQIIETGHLNVIHGVKYFEITFQIGIMCGKGKEMGRRREQREHTYYFVDLNVMKFVTVVVLWLLSCAPLSSAQHSPFSFENAQCTNTYDYMDGIKAIIIAEWFISVALFPRNNYETVICGELFCRALDLKNVLIQPCDSISASIVSVKIHISVDNAKEAPFFSRQACCYTVSFIIMLWFIFIFCKMTNFNICT